MFIENSIYEVLKERILVLDGAMGTMIQRSGLDFEGPADALVLSHPEAIADIHEKYLAAGADIISTNSFNANAVSLSDFGLSGQVYEINFAAARLARKKADEFTLRNPSKPRFVAGSMGPTNKTSSIAADPLDASAREVSFGELVKAYSEQARGLVDGGVDIILIETVFDTLNAKAALFAVSEMGVPVMVSGTIAGASGRTLSGQTVEAFWASVSSFAAPESGSKLLSIGLNCAFGAQQMLPYLERLAGVAECRISAHPNAGLPNLAGGYDQTASQFADRCEEFMRCGLLNIVGGCCGTTPEHTLLLALAAARYEPRKLPEARHDTVLSGLDTLTLSELPPPSSFVKIGERANVAGSARFARLVKEGALDEAIVVARAQIAAGAQVVDVCMDAPMIDGGGWMRRFLLAAAAEPELARVPWMVDSSSFEVLESGLRCCQGKALANSISLKEGEVEFLRRAGLIRKYGAAAVVMLFDERGQADTFARKIEVAERAYKLLTDSGFPPQDIVFDPNVLTIATGISEHDGYAVDFIEATRWIKQNLPHARVSAGVSNLSFAFRGNAQVREAMHSVFLHHAVAAGLDMAIVNVATALNYNELEPQLRALAEDVVLARRADSTERLTDFAAQDHRRATPLGAGDASLRANSKNVTQRIIDAFLTGDDLHIAADTLEALTEQGDAIEVIDRVLMPAMGEVGRLFGEGAMFLSQVVKSARVMRRAVDALTPYIRNARAREGTQKLLLATVRGDVHDIGKNIFGVVAATGGWEILDLGVMVEPAKIVDEAVRNSVSAIGLSGLITPSLHEMTATVRELERRGLQIPVLIGGATTSRLHTAVRIAPEYGGLVVHSRDASEGAAVLSKLQSADSQAFMTQIRAEQECLRKDYLSSEVGGCNAPEHTNAYVTESNFKGEAANARLSRQISELREHIDWPMFLAAWGVRRDSDEGRRLLTEAEAVLERLEREQVLDIQGVAGVFPARVEGDDIFLHDRAADREFRLPMLRNEGTQMSVVQWVNGLVGAFAITAGVGLSQFTEKLRKEGDEYSAIVAKLLADRLTEAFAETVFPESATVKRFAFGYPAVPDHSLKSDIFELLGVREKTAMSLTDSYMIVPGESLCGIVVDHPDARYFSLGRISDGQLADYARRRGMSVEEVKRLTGSEL